MAGSEYQCVLDRVGLSDEVGIFPCWPPQGWANVVELYSNP